MLCVLTVTKRNFLEMFTLPLIFIPIIPSIVIDGSYASGMFPLYIPILCRRPLRGGDITTGYEFILVLNTGRESSLYLSCACMVMMYCGLFIFLASRDMWDV